MACLNGKYVVWCTGVWKPGNGWAKVNWSGSYDWKIVENCINPFPHRTILQQTTLNIFYQKIENLFNWMDNLWLKVENIVSKGEIARFEQFLLLSLFSKSCLLQRRQKASIWGKGLNPNQSISQSMWERIKILHWPKECQSRGCEFESQLGQLSFRRLTKVNATCVIHLPPMG